ncbi:MAG: M48 family metalloprotease [Lachnospiraceae bacterium]|nr:M48 family metalloprotease [Lachnospiraceae bacterium]
MSLVISLVLYFVSVAIALSPIGEFILRLQTGCNKIKRIDFIEKLDPIFKEVYSRAKQENQDLPDDIELFIYNSKYKNAFAIGRKSICITKGMMHSSAEELKGVLGHEFAHIANHDTDLILVVTVGNMIVTGMILAIRLVFKFLELFGFLYSVLSRSHFGTPTLVISAIADIIVGFLMWIWTKLGQYLVLATGRQEEYYADEFSYKLGYSNGLCRFLDTHSSRGTKGLFAILSSTHPSTDDRIARLQSLGSAYRAS